MSVITDSLNSFLSLFGSSSLTQQASFRGVPFITETETDEEFGRRLAIHDYPNSSNRYAEDVGGFAGHFSLSGCVLGVDANTQYERLKAACNEKGSGELVLNVLGSYTVKCGKCSATCDTSESVERITFDLEFFISDDTPKVDMDVVNGLGAFSLGDNVFGALSNYLTSNFGFLKADTIAALMRGDLLGMCNSLLSLSGLVDLEDLNAFNRAISTIQKNASRFLYQAENLGDMLFNENGGAWRIMAPSAHYMGGVNAIKSITNIVNGYGETLSINPVNMDRAPENTIHSGKVGNNKWKETTANRISRNRQRAMLINIHKLSALSVGYLILANIDFTTSDDATDARDSLELAYLNLVHGQTNVANGDKVFSPVQNRGYVLHDDVAISQSFEALRVYSLRVLNNANNIAYRVHEVTLQPWEETSVLNVAYLSQAENIHTEEDLMDLTDKLADENDRIFKCTGQVRILT